MSIKNDYTDRRILRSKRALKEALVSLMQGKDFKDISITEIVNRADLNRGTFYKHYQYKEDLLQEMIDEVIADLIESFREPYKGMEVLEVNKLNTSAIKVFDHVSRFSGFYSLIVQSNTMAGFQAQFCLVLKDLALNDLDLPFPVPHINREMQASYQAYAILGMIVEWVNGGFKYSPSYMAQQLLEIMRHRQADSIVKPLNEKR
ncbi:TetR/AcrR family transcriptional regulator [Bacillus infantis]|jgi:AcrR family transcriptional regulator|uniref:TetR/AcrR family transcriptional regulator n=1 Tax=Bacillus infantis TaxID=324767 RepID=UPI002155240D|nr:TetR/AcrR family transcriptional regulator [Bacillus infantis]MCR6610664.1 TetR/AcrR family transcriptional regulator [Bacillus infantis]